MFLVNSGSDVTRAELQSGTEILGATEFDSRIEVLFREARRRRRRRWSLGVMLALVLVTGIVTTLQFSRRAAPPRSTEPRGGLPRWIAPLSPHHPPPVRFVSGDGAGGVGVYATATGRLVSHLSLQTGGGPDQQAVLASNGRTVYFAQPTGTCGGVIDTVPISGGTRAMTVIDEPGTLALEPEASPTSAELAWVGVTCEPGGTASTLYVTNVATGQLSDLGPYTGQGNDDGLSWSDDGTLLAVEAAPAIRILPIHDSTGTRGTSRRLVVPHGCTLQDPVFMSAPRQIAVVRTCTSASGRKGSSAVLVYDSATGRPVATVVSAPTGQTFESLSVDPTDHVLVGLAAPYGPAETARVVNGRLVPISRSTPTGAQW
jgi:hypothetical protein